MIRATTCGGNAPGLVGLQRDQADRAHAGDQRQHQAGDVACRRRRCATATAARPAAAGSPRPRRWRSRRRARSPSRPGPTADWASTTSRPPPLPESTAARSIGGDRAHLLDQVLGDAARVQRRPGQLPGDRAQLGQQPGRLGVRLRPRLGRSRGAAGPACTNPADSPAMTSHSSDARAGSVGVVEQAVVEAGDGEQPRRRPPSRHSDSRSRPCQRRQDRPARSGRAAARWRSRRRGRAASGARAERGDRRPRPAGPAARARGCARRRSTPAAPATASSADPDQRRGVAWWWPAPAARRARAGPGAAPSRSRSAASGIDSGPSVGRPSTAADPVVGSAVDCGDFVGVLLRDHGALHLQ